MLKTLEVCARRVARQYNTLITTEESMASGSARASASSQLGLSANDWGFKPLRFKTYTFVRLRKSAKDVWTYAYVLAPANKVFHWNGTLHMVQATK